MELIKPAIISLKNIRSVQFVPLLAHWRISWSWFCSWNLCSVAFFHPIIDSLAELTHLEEIYLQYDGSPWPDVPSTRAIPDSTIPLPRFRNLRHVSFGGIGLPAAHAKEYTDQIHSMMKSGTILTSIALTLPVSRDDNQPSSPPNILHDIFHNVPYKPNSNLRRLVLSGYSLKPNVFELPHFKGLTSLDISHANGFQTSEADAELWSVLKIACICLQHLSIEKVT